MLRRSHKLRRLGLSMRAWTESWLALLGLCVLLADPALAEPSASATNGSVAVVADHGSTVNVQLSQTRQELDEARRARDRLEQQSKKISGQIATLHDSISDINTRLVQTNQVEQEQIEALRRQLRDKSEELQRAEQAQRVQRAKVEDADRRIGALTSRVAAVRANIEHDRLTPDAYHVVGFVAAAVGCGTAIASLLWANSARSDLNAALSSDEPGITEMQAKGRADAVRRANLVQALGVGLWILGSAVGAMYIVDLAKGETPGLGVVAPQLGPHEVGALVAGRWDTL